MLERANALTRIHEMTQAIKDDLLLLAQNLREKESDQEELVILYWKKTGLYWKLKEEQKTLELMQKLPGLKEHLSDATR